MVVVMRPGTRQEDIAALAEQFKAQGLEVGVTNGVGCTSWAWWETPPPWTWTKSASIPMWSG